MSIGWRGAYGMGPIDYTDGHVQQCSTVGNVDMTLGLVGTEY